LILLQAWLAEIFEQGFVKCSWIFEKVNPPLGGEILEFQLKETWGFV
jgi:hypothetical protein